MKRSQTIANRLPDQPSRAHISRRGFLQTMLTTSLGVSGVNVLGAVRPFWAQDTRPLTITFQDWISPLHPGIFEINAVFPDLRFEELTPDFTQVQNGSSPWDVYVGMTPFVEMAELVQNGVIEAWDDYIPQEILDDMIPSIRAESTIDGKLYSWPFLVDVVVQSYNANIITAAGLADIPPLTWDDFLRNAAIVVETHAAPIGCAFDPTGWRSLAAIAHSFSPDVYYTLEGDTAPLFDFTHPAAIQALVVMKQMLDLSSIRNTTSVSFEYTRDEQVIEGELESQTVCYYINDQNTPLRFSTLWDDRSALRLAALPSGGSGSTAFWTTGACLFANGQNKEAAAEYMRALTYNDRIWQDSVAGTEASHTGQLPPYQSIYAEWDANQPEWLVANPWVELVRGQLSLAKAIPNHAFGARQFVIGRPHWEQFLLGNEPDPMIAMQAAKDAVIAAIQRPT